MLEWNTPKKVKPLRERASSDGSPAMAPGPGSPLRGPSQIGRERSQSFSYLPLPAMLEDM
jgi:hypothetical protein